MITRILMIGNATRSIQRTITITTTQTPNRKEGLRTSIRHILTRIVFTEWWHSHILQQFQMYSYTKTHPITYNSIWEGATVASLAKRNLIESYKALKCAIFLARHQNRSWKQLHVKEAKGNHCDPPTLKPGTPKRVYGISDAVKLLSLKSTTPFKIDMILQVLISISIKSFTGFFSLSTHFQYC